LSSRGSAPLSSEGGTLQPSLWTRFFGPSRSESEVFESPEALAQIAQAEGDILELEKRFPESAMVEQEIEGDPHGVPQSLIAFARSYSNLHAQCERHIAYCKPLLNFLIACAKGEKSNMVVVRDFCRENAFGIAKLYPQEFAQSVADAGFRQEDQSSD
jgi:hypothetical protein